MWKIRFKETRFADSSSAINLPSSVTFHVKFKGARGETLIKSLINTGADISLIPLKIARQIGAWRTNQINSCILTEYREAGFFHGTVPGCV